jgi:DNA gyrase/topoisomerase IV subunit A
VASAHSYILVFTECGRMHWLKVHEIPETGVAAKGKAIVNLLNLEPNERLVTTVAVREFRDDPFLFFATANGHRQEDRAIGLRQPAGSAAPSASTSTAVRGFGKRTPIADYRKQSRGGLSASSASRSATRQAR